MDARASICGAPGPFSEKGVKMDARASICGAPGPCSEKGVKMDARASICRAPGLFGLKERARVYLPGGPAFN